MIIDEKHYIILNELESKFGSVANVPEDNKDLKRIRKFLEKKRPGKKQKRDTSESQISYDIEFCYNLCSDRTKGITYAELSEEYGISLSSVINILHVYGIKRKRTFIADLNIEGERIVTDNFKDLMYQLNKFIRYRKLSISNARTVLHEGKLYKKSLTINNVDKYTEFTKDDIKRIAFERRMKQKSVKKAETAITFLNKINGKDFITYEETVKWSS